MWIIGGEESHSPSFLYDLYCRKDQLVKCQTLYSKMTAQEQKIEIFFFMLMVFSREPEAFRFLLADGRM